MNWTMDETRRLNHRLQRLAQVVVDLSQARSIDSIADIVRHAARELVGSDGATFVLRQGETCYYLDEDAIAPLWKGRRFPITACVSGWAMTHKTPALIEDIYADPRVPHDAYRPTFVKSLALVPVRTADPVAAIGNYWARHYHVTNDDLQILQALADSTSVAMENVRVYQELEERVRARTAQLEAANRDLESFSYSVAHDLRSPLNIIKSYNFVILEDYKDRLDAAAQEYLARVDDATNRMDQLIGDMLNLARLNKAEIQIEIVDVSRMCRDILANLARQQPQRCARTVVQDNIAVLGDRGLLRIAFENLLGNAWKFTGKVESPTIEVGAFPLDGKICCFVRDNGAGFDMARAEELFNAFRRFHSHDDFPGTGVGLATVQRVVHRHDGRIWAEAEPGKGATFYLTLRPADVP